MRIHLALSAAGLLFVLAGCGQAGALLVATGLVQEPKVPAEFEIPPGSVLVLVDDEMDLVQPPIAKLRLVDALARQFSKHDISDRVTTNQEIARLRQEEADFDRMSISEVGRRLNADTVLWVNVEDFALEDDLELVVEPARFVVRLKVFDPDSPSKRTMRLWPPEREGRILECEVDPHPIRRCKSMTEVHELIAERLADKIARLFYENRPEEE